MTQTEIAIFFGGFVAGIIAFILAIYIICWALFSNGDWGERD